MSGCTRIKLEGTIVLVFLVCYGDELFRNPLYFEVNGNGIGTLMVMETGE